jgi:hypothetical protein
MLSKAGLGIGLERGVAIPRLAGALSRAGAAAVDCACGSTATRIAEDPSDGSPDDAAEDGADGPTLGRARLAALGDFGLVMTNAAEITKMSERATMGSSCRVSEYGLLGKRAIDAGSEGLE